MTLSTYNLILGGGMLVLILLILSLIALRIAVGSKSRVMEFIRNDAILIGLGVGLAAVAGSLGYSEIYQLPPCTFCWWQRIFLYPQLIIFAVALYRHGRKSDAGYDIFYYSTPLAITGSLISLYHVFLQQGIIADTGACLVGGVSCTTIDIQVFGFMTIPMMALILGLALSLLGILIITHKKTA